MEAAAPPLLPLRHPSPLAFGVVLLLTMTDAFDRGESPLIIEAKLSWGLPRGQALFQNP